MAEQYALDRISDERTARIALSYAVPAGHELNGRFLQEYGGLQTVQFALGAEARGADPTTLRVWRSHFDGYDPRRPWLRARRTASLRGTHSRRSILADGHG